MLENAPPDPSIKRYTPPPRNRLLNRRKSGEKPIIYSGSSGSAWGSVKLPHQMDFLMELRHSIQAANGHINAGDFIPKIKASVPGRT